MMGDQGPRFQGVGLEIVETSWFSDATASRAVPRALAPPQDAQLGSFPQKWKVDLSPSRCQKRQFLVMTGNCARTTLHLETGVGQNPSGQISNIQFCVLGTKGPAIRRIGKKVTRY